jgi:hypothetical protein
MKQLQYRSLVAGSALVVLLGASGSAFALGEKWCKNSVAERFSDASMAEISVSASVPMKNGDARVDWSVQTEKTSAMGYCKVNKGGDVVKVKIDHHKKYHDSDSGGNSGSDEQDGFYYDKHIGKWRDPDGETCHTCTPENGFPDHNSSNRSSYKPKNKFERQMQKELNKSLSADDIKALNSLK